MGGMEAKSPIARGAEPPLQEAIMRHRYEIGGGTFPKVGASCRGRLLGEALIEVSRANLENVERALL